MARQISKEDWLLGTLLGCKESDRPALEKRLVEVWEECQGESAVWWRGIWGVPREEKK